MCEAAYIPHVISIYSLADGNVDPRNAKNIIPRGFLTPSKRAMIG